MIGKRAVILDPHSDHYGRAGEIMSDNSDSARVMLEVERPEHVTQVVEVPKEFISIL